MQNALNGLNDFQGNGTLSDELARCKSLNVTTLDEAGLDGPGIQDAICTTSSLSTSDSTMAESTANPTSSAFFSNASSSSTGTFGNSLSTFTPQTHNASVLSTSSMKLSSGLSTATRPGTAPGTLKSSSGIQPSTAASITTGNVSLSMPPFQNTTSIVRVTTFDTIWIVDTATSRPSSSKTGAMNGSTVTQTVTLTSDVDFTITITASKNNPASSSTSKPLCASERRPWREHVSWGPHPKPKPWNSCGRAFHDLD